MQVEPHTGLFSDDLAGEFAAAMDGMAVRARARVAVAVSGGADSMALVLLLVHWGRSRGVGVQALTVDHGLRAAAADEARQVGAWLAPLGVAHATLTWDEGPSYRQRPASAQAAAREARYRLLLDWCDANDVAHLFLAHHADDQAETFLLRLTRGSGVDGLAAMAPVTPRGGVRLCRPLLEISKSRLIAFCRAAGQPWIEDPSNQDEAYARARFRAARATLESEGLSPGRLRATAAHMRRARAALDHYATALLDEACRWDQFGVGRVALDAVLAAPEEIGLRALARILMVASGEAYRPRFERLSRLHDSLRAGPWRDATLHGCFLMRDGAVLTVVREAAQVMDEQLVRTGAAVVWDGRFEVAVRAGPPARVFRVRRFLQKDVPTVVRDTAVRDTGRLRELPAAARETLPAFFDSEGLAAVPSLNFVRPDLAAGADVTFTAAFLCPEIDQISEDDAEL